MYIVRMYLYMYIYLYIICIRCEIPRGGGVDKILTRRFLPPPPPYHESFIKPNLCPRDTPKRDCRRTHTHTHTAHVRVFVHVRFYNVFDLFSCTDGRRIFRITFRPPDITPSPFFSSKWHYVINIV